MRNFSPHILSIKKQFKQPPPEPQPLHCLPSGALFHFIIQLSLKCFLAVYSSFPLCRCGSDLQTGPSDQSVRCCQAEHLPPSGYLPVLSGLNASHYLFISTLLYLSGALLPTELRSDPEVGRACLEVTEAGWGLRGYSLEMPLRKAHNLAEQTGSRQLKVVN